MFYALWGREHIKTNVIGVVCVGVCAHYAWAMVWPGAVARTSQSCNEAHTPFEECAR